MALLPFVRFLLPLGTARWMFYSVLGLLGAALLAWQWVEGRRIRVGWLTLAFLCVCVLSVCFSANHEKFMAWQRLGAFILLLLVVGPLMLSHSLRRVRRRALVIAAWACVACAAYYNALYAFMVMEYCAWLSPYAWVFSHALGIAMLWAVLSAFGALFTAYELLRMPWPLGKGFCDGKWKAWVRCLWHLFCFLLCANSLIVASSRAALIAFSVALLCMCVLRWMRLGRIPRAGCAAALALAAFCVVSVIVPLTPGMEIKLKNVDRHDDYLASRRDLWGERETEIQRYRLFGTGFGCVDDQSLNSYRKPISNQGTDIFSAEPADGVIEPGSSWMYVLSATGIPGFVLFLLLVLLALGTSLRRAPVLPGLLIFFTLHMLVEGYVLSSGSVAAYLFWLTMACALPEAINLRHLLPWPRRKRI